MRIAITFRRIWLLLWKNAVLRKRHYIVTALEIVLPTLFAIMMAYLKAATSSQTSYNNDFSIKADTVTAFQEYSEQDLIDGTRVYCYTNYLQQTIAYTPDNDLTKEFTDILALSIKSYRYDDSGYNDSYECPSIKWVGFESEEAIELYNIQLGLNPFERTELLEFAIVFTQGVDITSNFPKDHKIAYKLRFTSGFYNTAELFPSFPVPGPGYAYDNYRWNGFSGVQILLDKIIIEHLTGSKPTWNISTQAFPYPPYQDFDFDQLYFFLLPQLLATGFIFIVPSILRGVVSEKETGIKELMKIMGLSNWMHWLGWMLNSMIVLIFTITIVIILFFVSFKKDAGAVVEYGDPTLWWVVLFLYAISASSSCFFVSAFFHRPTLAMTVGIALWLVSYYALAIPLEDSYLTLNLASKLAICLLPNMGLHYVIKIMGGFEGQATGARWSNIGNSVSSADSLTVGYVCLMFVVDTFMYIALTIYIENILPSKHGLRKPWYYIFLPREWGCKFKSDDSPMVVNEKEENSENDGFEREPEQMKPTIEIMHLSKIFDGSKAAVNDISLKIYDGQITALLGHNGAGKTTTLSMLTGMFTPTSGTAWVNGNNIVTDMDKVRENLGLCPQHNMLFDQLTVSEHISFFGKLKGMTIAEADKERHELLEKLLLTEKKDVLSMSLSGGQKRKLSLACALVGGTKVIILDEPTSGMDIESRRMLWNVLLEIRGQRTIILTTHFMEEADVLGDRICIMADGKIKCVGSPLFLKQHFGTGYTMKMITNGTNPDKILSTIQKHIPSAIFKDHPVSNSSEISFALPAENSTTSVFAELFSELTLEKTHLGIQNIGLSLTTIDDVFVKVGELSHTNSKHNSTTVNDSTAEDASWNGSGDDLQTKKLSGLKLALQAFRALLVKKLLYTYRKRRLFISQLIFPVIFLVAAILVSNTLFDDSDFQPSLTVRLSSYDKAYTIYASTDENLGDNFAAIAGMGSSVDKVMGNVSVRLLEIADDNLALYRQQCIVAGQINSTNMKAMYSSIPSHSSPLAINLMTNTLLRSMAPDDAQYSIEVTNHPLPYSVIWEILRIVTPNPSYTTEVQILFAVFMPIGLSLLAASYIVFPMEERLGKAKQLQFMTGVSPIVYWGASFLWDFFFILILVTIMIACFPIFENYSAFTNNNGAGVAFLILCVYGFGAISFSYLLSLFASSVAGGFALVTIVHLLTGMALNLAVFGLRESGQLVTGNTISWVGRLFPTFGAAMTTMNYARISTTNSRCNILSNEFKRIICVPEFSGSSDMELIQSCCDNCDELGADCVKPIPYLAWYEDDVLFDAYGELHGQIGIGQELLYMFIMGFVYKAILIMIEYGVARRILAAVFKTEEHTFTSKSDDVDVKAENERVRLMVSSGRTSDDAVVIENLCKSFGSFAAVSNINFGVHHGECFGLLGVNGAGKTTSFRILTGDEIRSDGSAYIMMNSLLQNRQEFLSKIGYCPQFDAMIGVLTGREMLQLFARLRGVPSNCIKKDSDRWLAKLGLSDSGDVECEKYSIGMKRRLSAAMALIGDSPIIMLDEPTTGVDPVARREFWKTLASVRNNGQAIILTSHSMEECEALCTRVGIMVNGEMQCLGGVQHLKNKFAQGFSLTLKLTSLIMDYPDVRNALNEQICRCFHPCTLKDQHQNILQYQINNTEMPWDVLFKTMEDIKQQYVSYVDEYSVSETTLEEVFLSFARKQYPNREADVSMFKKFLTCQCCK